ncbi:MAG: ABC-three component system protein [Kiritimatiellia bacterium]
MIHRIYSTDPRFKELNFHPGFNVVVAEKTSDARKDQTRNAAGKSSILECIHYCLGSRSRKSDTFAKSALDGQAFGLEFNLDGERVRVNRQAGPDAARNQVFFDEPIPNLINKELSQGQLLADQTIKLKRWTDLLGREAFGVPIGAKHTPSFRMAFSYFCRQDSDGGMHDPFKSSNEQLPWQRDVTLAFLLDLDWHILSRMETLRGEEKHLDHLRKELKGSGIVGQIIGRTSGLRAQLAVAEQRVRELEQQITGYRVLPEYSEIEKEASQLSRTIGDLSDRNTADRILINDLRTSLQGETEPPLSDLERLYASAGIQLPGVTLERLESVKAFHRTVIRNRKTHLEGEIVAAERRIQDREGQAQRHSKRQQELMGLLQTHGALDQFNKLQEELSRLRSHSELLKKQFDIAQKIEKGGADLEVQRATLHQSLIRDMEERAERLNEAALIYADLSKAVSERSSILEIEPTNKGLRLAITGGPDKSKGIREQQIFCLDMLLTVMQSKREKSLGFLVHDSHLFDAMDERQIANAIEVGARLSQQYGFQYIITMNSDRIPYHDFSADFDFDSHVIQPHLTDETETGGLFGFRFLQ